jgi:hypothetical protein
MLLDTTGDGLADSVHVDTSGDGLPDTIVPLGENFRGFFRVFWRLLAVAVRVGDGHTTQDRATSGGVVVSGVLAGRRARSRDARKTALPVAK